MTTDNTRERRVFRFRPDTIAKLRGLPDRSMSQYIIDCLKRETWDWKLEKEDGQVPGTVRVRGTKMFTVRLPNYLMEKLRLVSGGNVSHYLQECLDRNLHGTKSNLSRRRKNVYSMRGDR